MRADYQAQAGGAKKATGAIPLTKILRKAVSKLTRIDTAEAILRGLDDATRKESEVVARAVARSFHEKAQIVIGTTNTDVTVEKSASFWRGSVTQHVTMPYTATVALDLKDVLANVNYNPATRTIEVYLPPLSIIAVEPKTTEFRAEPTYSGGSWNWWDSGTATAMEVELLKPDWSKLARESVDANAEHLRKAAKNQTVRLLKGLLEPINPNLKVVVNP